MQLFMWQHDILGVPHYIMDCFDVLGAQSDAPDDALMCFLHEPWQLDVSHSINHSLSSLQPIGQPQRQNLITLFCVWHVYHIDLLMQALRVVVNLRILVHARTCL